MKINHAIGFIADVKAGKFDLEGARAAEMLREPNPNAQPNADVLSPWINSPDVLRRPRGFWLVDFGPDESQEFASRFEKPFAYVREFVFPIRSKVERKISG